MRQTGEKETHETERREGGLRDGGKTRDSCDGEERGRLTRRREGKEVHETERRDKEDRRKLMRRTEVKETHDMEKRILRGRGEETLMRLKGEKETLEAVKKEGDS